MTHIIRTGKGKETSWLIIAVAGAIGALVYLVWPMSYIIYCITSIAGAVTLSWTFSAIGRNLVGFKKPDNDVYETFEQCDDKIETEDSINIKTKYQYQKKQHVGWVNVVNPFRATMVLGTPGSGKSFSVYNPFIEQMINKEYTMLCYDYKYPDLSEIVYNMALQKYPLKKNPKHKKNNNEPEYIRDPKSPEFFVINFNDARYSNRCNPIKAEYIKDPADSAEVADIVMKNVAPGTVEKEDFFSMSAKVYLDAIIYFLSIYKGGKYCTFPHVIELMSVDYKKVFAILSAEPKLETKIKPFASALAAGAQDQLQGQIASATIPLNKMASPQLYWVMSGDDFTLDINNPEHPKIVCIGNDPDRQAIYGTTLALYTSRLFKLVNHKKKRKCAVLLDELPTIFIKGLDNLIATARSNKVAIVFGAQDKSQLIRDYSEKEANVIFNTVGNIFSGQVNGKTAEDMSRSFGKEFREQQSQTLNLDSDSLQISFHEQEIMPISKIETLTQGYFFGKVADNNDTPIEKKFFCGEIQIDVPKWKEKTKKFKPIPLITDFGEKEIYTEVHNEPMRTNVLNNYAESVIAKTKGFVTTEKLKEDAEVFLKSLTEKEIEKILKDEAEILIKKKVDEMIEMNFLQIREDVKNIIREELDEEPDSFTEDDEEEEEGYQYIDPNDMEFYK